MCMTKGKERQTLISEAFIVVSNSKPLPDLNSSPEQDSNPGPNGPKSQTSTTVLLEMQK
jgi:hypothetical protein